jgi:transposase
VHHLRALTFVEEELKQDWARKMKDLLLDMKAEVEQAKALGQHELDVLVLAHLLRRYDEILTEGYLANPPPPPLPPKKRTPGKPKQSPARNLLDRLSQSKWAVLRFLLDFAVPFDNNQAERDLRMIPRPAKGLRLLPHRTGSCDVLSHPQLPLDLTKTGN